MIDKCKQQKPVFSVIIPLYNKELIVEKTIKSVLQQSFTDFELIIVDDGSTDNSLNIVKSIDDKRISIVEQTNGGPSKARNTGIRYAQSNWLYFIDADDEMLPNTLENFHNYIIKYPQQKMFCGEIITNNKVVRKYREGILENAYKATFLGQLYQCSGSSVYLREVCVECPYDENLRRYEDLECLFNKYRKSKVVLLPIPVGKVNIDYSEASTARKDINEDFTGHLIFRGKSFWEKMALYNLYLGERCYYEKQINNLYPYLQYRYDILFLYKILNFIYK